MAERCTTQRLDHWGIVAGICQEIGLAEQIDRIVGPTERQVSVGEAVQAMVMNALGFTGRPLYLTPEFFADKPLERLLRPALRAEFRDDSLGWALSRREFSSREEAEAAVRQQEKAWRYHRVECRYQPVAHYARQGCPSAGTTPQRVGFRLQGKVVERAEEVAAARKRLGKWILATNELDEGKLPAEQMLAAYRGQGVEPERGFRFLKDPWFFADSLFLKNLGRIMALVMVMGLALLVYALAERKLRTAL